MYVSQKYYKTCVLGRCVFCKTLSSNGVARVSEVFFDAMIKRVVGCTRYMAQSTAYFSSKDHAVTNTTDAETFF
jgi:hypothetical protein